MAELYAENKAAQVGVAACFSFLVAIDLIGNTLVILIILTNNSLKSPMNYLLVNLAVADLMVGVFLVPVFVFNYIFTHPDGLAGRLLCSLLTGGNIAWVAQISSCLSLVSISIERYFAIMHPFSVKDRLSAKKVKRMNIASWVCALIFGIPLFFVYDYDQRNAMCTDRWPESKLWLSESYSLAWFLVIGIMPIAIMFVLYSRVIYTLWFKQHQVQGTQLAMFRSRKRVTKMMVTVSVVYAVCIFPNVTMYYVNHISNITDYSITFVLSFVLIACNSAINPFIYTLQSTTFRRYSIGLICCRNICKNRLGIQAESIERQNKQETRIRLNNFSGLGQLDIH